MLFITILRCRSPLKGVEPGLGHHALLPTKKMEEEVLRSNSTANDIYDEIRGQSALNHDRTVKKKFHDCHGYHVQALAGLDENRQKEDFGVFANELFTWFEKDGVPAYQTSMNYLSSLAQVFKKELHGKKEGIFADKNWYSLIRGKLFKKYLEWSQRTGRPLIESPDPLTEEALRLLCEYEFKLNTKKGLAVRCVMTVMWTVLGRAAEVGMLTIPNLRMDSANQCLVVNLIRTKGVKIGRPTGLGLFIRRNSWMHCPMHTIGSYFMLHPMLQSENKYWFPDLADKSVSSYVNAELKAFKMSLPEEEPHSQMNITAHSSRHGSAQAANSNPSINVTWIIERGEWTLDRLNTAFEYLFGSSRNDRKVARVLSGWHNAESGGNPPSLDIFNDEELRTRLKNFSMHLFNHDMPIDVKELLLAVQIMYYEDVKNSYPDHLLIHQFEDVASKNEFSKDDLMDMGAQLVLDFRRRNLAFVTPKDASITESIDKLRENYTELTHMQLEDSAALRNEMKELRVKHSNDMQTLLNEIRGLKTFLECTAVAHQHSIPTTSASSSTSSQAPDTRTRSKRKQADPKELPAVTEFPRTLRSLQGVTMSAAFFQYIDNDLENCQAERKYQSALSDLRKNYSFCCEMAPELRELPKKPAQSGKVYQEWRSSVQNKIFEHCEKVYDHLKAEKEKAAGKLGSNVSPCVKFMRQLEGAEKPAISKRKKC